MNFMRSFSLMSFKTITNNLISLFSQILMLSKHFNLIGEQISALIAGYIDIILRKRSQKERFGEDGNEEEVLEESFIAPGNLVEKLQNKMNKSKAWGNI